VYPRAYTMSSWRVTTGQEIAFREAWTDLDRAFATLRRRPLSGTLLQHRTDPTLFISLGSWTSAEDIEAMRRDATAQDAFLRVIELCDDAEMSSFIEVAHYEHYDTPREEEGREGRSEAASSDATIPDVIPEVTIEIAHLEVQHLEVSHAEVTTEAAEDGSERPRGQEDEAPPRRKRRRVTRRRVRKTSPDSGI
jgi:heme-degrading monooxygenase HmoA